MEEQVLHTTSHYPLRQAETTQEETAAPGKLPETPLRMEPSVLYEDAPEEKVNPDDLLPDVPLRQSPSSYNVRSKTEPGFIYSAPYWFVYSPRIVIMAE